MSENNLSHSPEDTYVLVTGANSGLGFSICCRLADEFLKTRPQTASLNIIFTTRSLRKAQDTSRRLEAHLRKNNPNPADFSRVRFLPESVDLGSLISVRACSRRLNSIFPKLDAIILNAGIGGWSGIDWPVAIFGIITDLLHQSTWPIYKLAPVGVVTDKQTPIKELEEPALGAVFCANTFGHYMLAHNVAPLLKRAKGPDGPGRVVWVSSIEASVKFFDVRDIQGLRCDAPYESSKTLTDILALTSDLPSTAPWAVDSFMSSDGDANKEETEQSVVPGQYISHPGVCATSIVPLPLPLVWAMMLAFWAARMLGSPWHTLSTYLGANSSVFLALSPKATLDAAEEPYRQAGGGKVKWGSSASRRGVGSVACTETVGWGYGGVVGTPVVEADRQRRRKRGASDLTAEQKEDFEELGRECWKQMEELRIKWDRILDEAEKRQNE